MSYTITITNYGLATATGVVVTDALPAALAFVSATSSQGAVTNSGGVVSCTVGNLNVAAGARIIINVTANIAGYVTNSASTSANQTDFNPANNTGSAVVLVTGAAPLALSVTVTNGSQLFLNWPYPSSGYNLETTTNLAPAGIWSSVTNSISNNGLINFVILNVNPAERERFYRLHHP